MDCNIRSYKVGVEAVLDSVKDVAAPAEVLSKFKEAIGNSTLWDNIGAVEQSFVAYTLLVTVANPNMDEAQREALWNTTEVSELAGLYQAADITHLVSPSELARKTPDQIKRDILLSFKQLLSPKDAEKFTKSVITDNISAIDKGVVVNDDAAIDQINEDIELVDEIVIGKDDVNGDTFNRNRYMRMVAAEGISKTDSKTQWETFVEIYFPNELNEYSTEFLEFVRDEFDDVILELGAVGDGFIQDVNASFASLFNRIKDKTEAYANSVMYQSEDLQSDVSLADSIHENTQDGYARRARYFHDVLLTEFDFIVANIIKIARPVYHTVDEHEHIDGVIELVNNAPKYSINTDDIVTGIEYELNTTTPNSDSSSIDVLRTPYMTSTVFALEFVTLLKTVNKDSNGNFTYGRRMTSNDLRRILPHLLNSNREVAGLEKTLRDIADKHDGELGSVARSFLFHVFSTEDSVRINRPAKNDHFNDVEVEVNSLRYIYNMNAGIIDYDGNAPFDAAVAVNINVVDALFSTFTSAFHERFIFEKDNFTQVTKSSSFEVDASGINTYLSTFITDKGFTKKRLANNIEVDVLSAYEADSALKIRAGAGTEFVRLDDINTEADIKYYATYYEMSRMMGTILEKLKETSLTPVEVTTRFKAIFNAIMVTAALNIQQKTNRLPLTINTFDKDPGFSIVSPSNILFNRNLGVLLDSLLKEDITSQANIAGKNRAIVGQTNRTAFTGQDIKKFQKAFHNNMFNKAHYSPFIAISRENLGIKGKRAKAKADRRVFKKAIYKGVFTKGSNLKNSATQKISSWDERLRTEYMLINGFIKAPDQVGKYGTDFMLQALGYSDKEDPQLFHIGVSGGEYYLQPGHNRKSAKDSNTVKLVDEYIDYQRRKAKYLQNQMIGKLKLYVVGEYHTLREKIIAHSPTVQEMDFVLDERLEALSDLKDHLLDFTFDEYGDVTRDINMLLDQVGIQSEWIQFSGSDLVIGADYITINKKSSKIFLKPNAGKRAEVYEDTDAAKDSVWEDLKEHRKYLEGLGVSDQRVSNAISSATRHDHMTEFRKLEPKVFYDRVFLINGIFGNAMKNATMGDVTFFGGKYKYDSIDAYYETATGLEEHQDMLIAQSKRAAPPLTRGVLYDTQKTYVGEQLTFNSNNLARYVTIHSGDKNNLAYMYEKLKGKTAIELQGLGIVVPFEDGSLIKESNGVQAMRFNYNNDIITITNGIDGDIDLIREDDVVDAKSQRDGVLRLMKDVIAASSVRNDEGSRIEENVFSTTKEITTEGGKVMAYGGNKDWINTLKELVTMGTRKIALADQVPSLMMTDPVSRVNLLNKMDVEQENSDAVQFVHGLLARIRMIAKGEELGGFYNSKYAAEKTLNTSVNYHYGEHAVQKNSTQVHFSFQQMQRIGGVALNNAFETMNTAITFQKQIMEVPVLDANNQPTDVMVKKRFKNLKGLMDHFNFYQRAEEQVWADIAHVLMHYPVNLHSFIGYYVLPSAQKTGQKQFNKYETAFDPKGNVATDELNISYSSNEYNLEVLSKDHDHDTTDGSTIALLSQLVNAVAFGGITNLETMSLQNGLASIMEINGAAYATSLVFSLEDFRDEFSGADIAAVKKHIEAGDLSNTDMLSVEQVSLMEKIVRGGVSGIIESAFPDGADTALIKALLHDDDLSLDLPLEQKNIMSTLKSNFFKSNAKPDIAGFQAVVSPGFNTSMMYEFSGADGKASRLPRGSFIKHLLTHGDTFNSGAVLEVITSDMEEDVRDEALARIKKFTTPLDFVRIEDTFTGDVEYKKVVDISVNEFSGGHTIITAVLTPDTQDSSTINNIADFEKLSDLDTLEVQVAGKTVVRYVWFLREQPEDGEEHIEALLANGPVKKDLSEKYGIKWYEYTNKNTGKRIELSEAYKEFYRIHIEEDKDDPNTAYLLTDARAVLIAELQSKEEGADGNMVNIWESEPPEIILPNFLASGFNIPENMSLDQIRGTIANEYHKTTAENFANFLDLKKFDKLELSTDKQINREAIISRLDLLILTNPGDNVYAMMRDAVTSESSVIAGDKGRILSRKEIEEVNIAVKAARQIFINAKATDFLKMLNVVAARIPGQTKQSGFNARVVEFLDVQRNMVMAPTEHLVNTGGDFDIDTLSIMVNSLGKDGFLPQYDEYLDDEGVFDREILLADFKKSSDRVLEEVRVFANKYNENILRMAEAAETKEEYEKSDKLRKKLYVGEKLKKLELKVLKGVKNSFINISTNIIVDSMSDSLRNMDAAVEVNTPISFGIFDPIIKKLSDGKEDSRKYSDEDYTYVLRSEQEAMQGKEGIGVYATAMKVNSLIQASYLFYVRHYKDKYAATIKSSGKRNGIYKDPFSFNVSISYYSTIQDKNIKVQRSSFADIDENLIVKEVSNNETLKKALLQENEFELNKDEILKPFMDIILDKLGDTYINNYHSKEAVETAISTVESLLGYRIESELRKQMGAGKTAFKELITDYLLEGDTLALILSRVVGRQNSAEIQSQFLSAATDNAKELLLGKIRSNPATVSMITAMMTVGFDVETMIDFLFDPKMDGIIALMGDKIYNAEGSFITAKDIESMEIGKSAFGKSVITLLNISDDLRKLRSIRSLMENFKVDQHKLDGMIENLFDAKKLYKAIVNDDINMVAVQSNDKRKSHVINPDMLIFLHPQSRLIFKTMYELETFYTPTLVDSMEAIRTLGKGARNEVTYKKIYDYLGETSVTSFFENAVPDNNTTDGKKLVGYSIDEDDVKMAHDLSTPPGRKAFVANFPSYFEKTKVLIEAAGGGNAFLNKVGPVDIFGVSVPVYGVPDISKRVIEEADESNIKGGVKSMLNRVEGKEVLNRLNREMHMNFSLYAMIVTDGRKVKGGILHLFDGINMKLARYQKSHKEIYDIAVGKGMSKAAQNLHKELVQGKVKTEEEYEEARVRKMDVQERNEYHREKTAELNEKAARSVEEDMMSGRMSDEDRGGPPEKKDYSFKMRYGDETIISTSSNAGKVFKGKFGSSNKDAESPFGESYFLGGNYDSPVPEAYRLFKSESKGDLSNSTTTSLMGLPGIENREFLDVLAMHKYQIGLETTYTGSGTPKENGVKSRVLSYAGLGGKSLTVPMYNVYIDGEIKKVPSPLITREDPNIILDGQKMAYFSYENSSIRAKLDDVHQKLYESLILESDIVLVAERQTVTASTEANAIFDPWEIVKSSALKMEATMVGNYHAADTASTIMQVSGQMSTENSFRKFNRTKVIPKALLADKPRAIFIPSAFSSSKGADASMTDRAYLENAYDTKSIKDEQKKSVVMFINDLDVNIAGEGVDSISFYGISMNNLLLMDSKTELAGKEGSLDIVRGITNSLNSKLYKVTEVPGKITVSRVAGAEVFTIIDNKDKGAVKSIRLLKDVDSGDLYLPARPVLDNHIKIELASRGVISVPIKKLGNVKLPILKEINTEAAMMVSTTTGDVVFSVSRDKLGVRNYMEVIPVSKGVSGDTKIRNGKHLVSLSVYDSLVKSLENAEDSKISCI